MWKYENLECDICKKQEESQKHIMECSEILKENGFKKVEYNEHENQRITNYSNFKFSEIKM